MVENPSQTQILSHIPLFTGLNERQLKKLAQRLIKRDYNEGQAIIKQGQGGEGLFILAEGTAEAIRLQPDGEKITVNEFTDTDYFGELALLDEGLRTASVVATSPAICLVLTRWDLKGILQEEPDMAVNMLVELAKRFRRALETL